MSARLKSLSKGLNPASWKIGLKLNLLVYCLLFTSFIVITLVGLNFMGDKLKQNIYNRLEQLAYYKTQNLNKEYNKFLAESKKIFSGDLIYNIEELKSAFNSYESDQYMMFNPDTLDRMKKVVKDYYEEEIIGNIPVKTPDLEAILPTGDLETVLQYTYIVNNKWPAGEKDKLFDPKNGSAYAYNHLNVHVACRTFARKYNINNLYLIDNNTGDIFYNLNKNIAFGTNLFEGPYKTTELARIFQKASVSSANVLSYSDYTPFIPQLNKHVAYIALPVIQYNEHVAVAVIELTPVFFEGILYDSWLYKNYEEANINLLGPDHKFRMNDIQQYSSPKEYSEKLNKRALKDKAINRAYLLGEGAGNLSFSDRFFKSKSNLDMVKDFNGVRLLSLNFPVELEGFDWTLTCFTTLKYHKKAMSDSFSRLLFAYIFLIIVSSIALRKVILSLINRLKKLAKASSDLASGKKAELVYSSSSDELGETMNDFNSLNERISEASNFAIQLSEGNYDLDFKEASSEDNLAQAFNTLNNRLVENKKELEQREKDDKISQWHNDGIAKFNDLLRQSNNDIRTLSFIVIENLVEYLDANQGGVFLVEGESDENKYISQIAGFAYDRKKYAQKRIEIGEGLIGNCYLEKKSIYLNNIPEDYISVSSGLGEAVPKSLYIVPLINDSVVLGFVELASFEIFENYQVEFIEKLAENIAATFSTVKLNTRTAELLEESKRRANEIAQQEEEMRQNMEEMQATQEELARLREEDERKQQEQSHKIESGLKTINSLLNAMDGQVIIKDSQGVIVLANDAACKRYNTTPESIKGKLDTEVLDKAIIESEKELDASTQIEGGYTGYRTENVNGTFIDFVIEKRLFTIPDTKDKGIITICKKADKEVE